MLVVVPEITITTAASIEYDPDEAQDTDTQTDEAVQDDKDKSGEQNENDDEQNEMDDIVVYATTTNVDVLPPHLRRSSGKFITFH